MRCGEIVAVRRAEFEKCRGDPDADDVRADVLVAGVAAAIAEKPRYRPFAAGLQRAAEHVFRNAI